jgi:Ca-activated chloride channel family protein
MILQGLSDSARSSAQMRMPLWGNLALSDPIFLLLVPLALLALFWGARRLGAARIPVLPDRLPRSPLQRWLWIPTAFKAIALTLAVMAMARPLRGDVRTIDQSEGVDIALLLDRSSSMEARATPRSPRRFDIAREVLADFATRRMTDNEGAADNVALFGFSGYCDLLVPFTLDADAFRGVLEAVDTNKERDLGGTGIGVAIARAVETFKDLDSDARIIILLTDGENNIDTITPRVAGMMAQELGIKVYTIFVGPTIARYPGGLIQRVQTADLEQVAENTGARFFHAEDATQLGEVYKEIEGLERRPREEERHADSYDLYPRLLLPALLLYVLAGLSSFTWARRLP